MNSLNKACMTRLLGVGLGSICLLGLSACDNGPLGPLDDSDVQQTFDRHWPEYEFAVNQCVTHPALWVIGNKEYIDEYPERQRKYADLNADDMAAYSEIQSMLDNLRLKAVYCDRDRKTLGGAITGVSFIYRDTDQPNLEWSHRIVFYSFNDAKDKEDAASVKRPLILLGKPHWYLTPGKFTFDAGEY
jgi:hypothetical protein